MSILMLSIKFKIIENLVYPLKLRLLVVVATFLASLHRMEINPTSDPT